jgi:hypothetical protein
MHRHVAVHWLDGTPAARSRLVEPMPQLEPPSRDLLMRRRLTTPCTSGSRRSGGLIAIRERHLADAEESARAVRAVLGGGASCHAFNVRLFGDPIGQVRSALIPVVTTPSIAVCLGAKEILVNRDITASRVAHARRGLLHCVEH